MSLKAGKNRGFTLVEILMTMIIFSISLFGILMLFSKGTMFISEVHGNDIVVNLLEEQMELIRQNQFSAIIALPSTFTLPGFTQLGNPKGYIVVDTPPGVVIPSNLIVRVTVTITWDSSLSRSLVTYVTYGGISS